MQHSLQAHGGGGGDLCVNKLLSFFTTETDHVTAEALVAMTSALGTF